MTKRHSGTGDFVCAQVIIMYDAVVIIIRSFLRVEKAAFWACLFGFSNYGSMILVKLLLFIELFPL